MASSFGQVRYRQVPAEILLPAGWVTGTFVVPEGISEAIDQRGRGHPGKLPPDEFDLGEAGMAS
jgi:hypothetical protein